MRPSPLKHTLAVLRNVIGLRQKELAGLLECSVPTVQAVELCKLPLSQKLADRIVLQTRVCPGWLWGGLGLSEPPRASGGEPYTRQIYEERQAELARRATPVHATGAVLNDYDDFARTVGHILRLAAESGHLALFTYKIGRALDALLGEVQRQLSSQRKPGRKVLRRTVLTDGIVLPQEAVTDPTPAQPLRMKGAKRPTTTRRPTKRRRQEVTAMLRGVDGIPSRGEELARLVDQIIQFEERVRVNAVGFAGAIVGVAKATENREGRKS